VWLAKLTEKGLLRPSFVPPAEIRRLRDYTRLREDLTRERSRYRQRPEKLLEDALIKVSVVASRLDTMSTRDMIEALIGGERDPRRLAELARGKMRAKRSELITALDGRFDDHHAGPARLLPNQIDALSAQINTLTGRIEDLIAELPEAGAVDHGGGDDAAAPNGGDGSGAGSQQARAAELSSPAPRRADSAELHGLDPARNPHLWWCSSAQKLLAERFTFEKDGYDGEPDEHCSVILGYPPTLGDAERFVAAFTKERRPGQ